MNINFQPQLNNNQNQSFIQYPTEASIENDSNLHLLSFNYIDVRGWGLNRAQTILLASLSGLVNQNHAELWIVWENEHWNWLQSMNQSLYRVNSLNIMSLKGICEYYASNISGLIYYSDLPEMLNIATPLCGIERALVVHESLWNELLTYTTYSTKPIKYNLTEEYYRNGFTMLTHQADIYNWAFDRWFDQCNQTALALCDVGIDRHIRSFLFSQRIFTIFQPMLVNKSAHAIDDERSQAFFYDFLAKTPQDMIVYGYMFPDGSNEHPVVKALSQTGKYLVPSDFMPNLEVFYQLPLPEGYEFRQNRTLSLPKIERKVYIAGIYSDGDNIQYVTNFMRSQIWLSQARLNTPVPIAYEISPTLSWLAPFIMYYYYESATINDYFVPGVGGKGYVKSEYCNSTYFRTYYETTRDLMRKSDMREMRSWESNMEPMTKILNANKTDYHLDAIYDGYGGIGDLTVNMIDNVPQTWMNDFPREKSVEELTSIAETLTRPQFMVYHLICWNAPYAKWSEFCANVSQNPNIVVVRLDQLSQLMQEYYKTSQYPMTISYLVLIISFVGIISWIHHLIRIKHRR